jgi:molybdopterin/thiamine biosynthesis adenylyltransferase
VSTVGSPPQRSDRWSRLEDVIDVDALGTKRVAVIGLGSGGSTVALELGKAGVGGFVLIDPDKIESANVIRHECDDRYIGVNKAEAVADLIRHRNPDAEVTVIPEDVFSMGPRLERSISDADLVAVCTDNEASRNLLNRLCTQTGTPAVYAGVYERATGGEVIRCRGEAGDACFACVTSVLKEDVPIPESEKFDYGAIDGNGVLHGAPGLGLDVRTIALIHAKMCLDTLTGENDIDADVVLFGNAVVEGLFPRPFASTTLRISPQQGCLVCEPIRTGELAQAMPLPGFL